MDQHRMEMCNELWNGKQLHVDIYDQYSLAFKGVPATQQAHHMCIDGPLISQRLTGVRKGRHIIRRTEFGQDREPLPIPLLALRNPVPPGKMGLDGSIPFRGPGIVYLRTLGMADAGMDMVGPLQGQIYRSRLILEEALADVAPMRHVKGYPKTRVLLHIGPGHRGRIQHPGPVRLMTDRYAGRSGELLRMIDERLVLPETEIIFPRMAIDIQGTLDLIIGGIVDRLPEIVQVRLPLRPISPAKENHLQRIVPQGGKQLTLVFLLCRPHDLDPVISFFFGFRTEALERTVKTP